MKVTSLMLRKIRSSQPSRTASEAYAEMERARAASLKASMPATNGAPWRNGRTPREAARLRAFTV